MAPMISHASIVDSCAAVGRGTGRVGRLCLTALASTMESRTKPAIQNA
jgi:hypothetical protein